jgi:murein DD-endopeptidase MepM/ murein hydrolase activator NlpD
MLGSMSVYTSRGRPPRRSRAARVFLVLGVLLAVLVAGVAVSLFWPAGPRPGFQLPVACGETWRLSTYPGHGEYDVDLIPTKGTAWGRPILASAAGTVAAAGINGELGGRTPKNPKGPIGDGGGYWVKIDHGGRWETQYLHMLEPPMVEVGQEVAQGQQLGKIGSTGDSGAPHLHYEQRRGWSKVETHFDGQPSGITHDGSEYAVTRASGNCG